MVQFVSPPVGPSSYPFGQLQHAPAQEDISPAVRCAENTILLELLSPVPEILPIQGPRGFSQDRHSNAERTLTLAQEHELATNLAFLTGITDNPNYIMAVCIEELPKVGGCQVMLAINKRFPADGDATLDKVQRGFQEIFETLKDLSLGMNHP